MATYEQILTVMQQEYHKHTGFFADDASDIGIRLKVLATQLSTLDEHLESLKTQVFPQTATDLQLDYHAQTRGLQRKKATVSLGVLRFSRETPAPSDIIIPAGVVCSVGKSDTDLNLRFETTEQGVIPAGFTYVDIPAQSSEGGTLANTAPDAVTVMITPVQAISSVTNPIAFTGGSDRETDKQLRARLMSSFATISNGTNAAFYYDFAMGFDGVASAKVVPRVNGRGTVGVYVAGVGAPVPDALVTEIQKQLTDVKEINVDVTVANARLHPVDITLEIAGASGVNYEHLKAACEHKLTEYFHALRVGQNLLLAGVLDALYHIEGLYNYKLITLVKDIQAESDVLFTLGSATISRMAVVI